VRRPVRAWRNCEPEDRGAALSMDYVDGAKPGGRERLDDPGLVAKAIGGRLKRGLAQFHDLQ
jgi:hypothetical protein